MIGMQIPTKLTVEQFLEVYKLIEVLAKVKFINIKDHEIFDTEVSSTR